MNKRLPTKPANRSSFSFTKQYIVYATEDQAEFDILKNQYRNVVFTDRTRIAQMKAVQGTQKLHFVASDANRPDDESSYYLRIARMPCSCLSCRGKQYGPCKFGPLCQEKRIVVKAQDPEEVVTARSQLDKQLEDNVLAKLQRFLGAVDKVTVANMRAYLRLRNERLSGTKRELAERVMLTNDPQEDGTAPVLAIHLLQEVEDIQDDVDVSIDE